MKYWWLVIVLLICPSLGHAASFDCDKERKTPLEILICSDKQLSALDSILAQQYKEVRAAAKPNEANSDYLLNEQHQFLKQRSTQCPMPDASEVSETEAAQVQECLRNLYYARLEKLKDEMAYLKLMGGPSAQVAQSDPNAAPATTSSSQETSQPDPNAAPTSAAMQAPAATTEAPQAEEAGAEEQTGTLPSVAALLGGPSLEQKSPWIQHFYFLLLGLFIGAFCSQKLRSVRKYLLILGICAAVTFGVYRFALYVRDTDLKAQTDPGNIASFLIGMAIAWRLLRDKIKQILEPEEKPITFGSAEWATVSHLMQHNIVGMKGLFLGVHNEGDRAYPLQYAGPRHLLTVAPTRSGKGTAAIIPNLLTYEGSTLIVDPKGENARISSARRGAGDEALGIPGMGQAVFVVDPWGITGAQQSRINPLDWLKPNDADIVENALLLADCIIVPDSVGGSSSTFFEDEARSLLMGLMLYVALDPREDGNRHLGRVRDIIRMGDADFKKFLSMMFENTNPIVSSTAERTVAKEPKLRSNVLAALQAQTHFLDIPGIRESLRTSDFRFEDMKTNKITVYLVLPADRLEPFGRWLRLLVQQAVTVNARNIHLRPERPILFLLDEFAVLGNLKMVKQAYSLMAGFGMQLWAIIQDLGQLEEAYGKGWETFIGNSGVIQYFGSRDFRTAEYISKLCGVTTVTKKSASNAIGRAMGRVWSSTETKHGGQTSTSTTSGGSQTDSYTDTYNSDISQRHLAFPDELMTLRDGKQILFVETSNPIPARRVNWFESERFRSLGVNLHAQSAGTKEPEAVILPQ